MEKQEDISHDGRTGTEVECKEGAVAGQVLGSGECGGGAFERTIAGIAVECYYTLLAGGTVEGGSLAEKAKAVASGLGSMFGKKPE